ncbi:sarcoplasmic/endoplasmic reticulum calcium ATPase regulator ARLN isoform X2 [Tamandua tetradactyla]
MRLGVVSGTAKQGRARAAAFQLLELSFGEANKMEANAEAADGGDGVRRRRGLREAGRPRPGPVLPPQSGTKGLPKTSYWFDIWVFILFYLVVFFFVYFLP